MARLRNQHRKVTDLPGNLKWPQALLAKLRSGRHYSHVAERSARIAAFFPGAVLLGLGVSILLFPKLWLAALAAFFIFMGALVFFVTWRLLRLKRQLDGVLQNMQAKVYIQPAGGRARPQNDFLLYEVESRKNIIVH